MPKRPHLLIFNPDQWRGDVLGHMGDPAAVTPNLDRLAAEDGVSFRHAFIQNPVCTPSRCSFMTGWYPHVRGHRTMHHMLRRDEPVLLKTLKEAGYFVWWGGKNDLVPGQEGFDHVCDVKYAPPPGRVNASNSHAIHDWRGAPEEDNYYSFLRGKLEPPAGADRYIDGDWAMVEGALELIRTYDGDKPLCIYLPIGFPHPPYCVEEPWFSMIDRDAIPDRTPAPEGWAGKPSLLAGIAEGQGLEGWTEDRWRELRAVYYGMCARVDHQFGLLVEALKERGLYDETAAFVFSDHGDFTGDYGLVEKTQNTFEDCLSRVPFLVKPPAGVPVRPGVREALVELVDFPATVFALTGIEPDWTHFGRSLLPVIAGGTDTHRDAVFCEGGRLPEETHTRETESLTTFDPPSQSLYYPRIRHQVGDGPEHGKATMCRTAEWKYVRRLCEEDELYDLRRDPRETRNLAADPACADVLASLKERMLRFYQETADVVPFSPDQR